MRRQSLQKQSLPLFFVAFEYQASDKARQASACNGKCECKNYLERRVISLFT